MHKSVFLCNQRKEDCIIWSRWVLKVQFTKRMETQSLSTHPDEDGKLGEVFSSRKHVEGGDLFKNVKKQQEKNQT